LLDSRIQGYALYRIGFIAVLIGDDFINKPVFGSLIILEFPEEGLGCSCRFNGMDDLLRLFIQILGQLVDGGWSAQLCSSFSPASLAFRESSSGCGSP
jgi:hypothetical protein